MNTDLKSMWIVNNLNGTLAIEGSQGDFPDRSQILLETIDEACDQIDVAQRFEEIYISEALYAFSVERKYKQAHAQERLLQGLSGICEDCQKEIPLERLEASQYEATRCVSCQKQHDLKQGR